MSVQYETTPTATNAVDKPQGSWAHNVSGVSTVASETIVCVPARYGVARKGFLPGRGEVQGKYVCEAPRRMSTYVCTARNDKTDLSQDIVLQ